MVVRLKTATIEHLSDAKLNARLELNVKMSVMIHAGFYIMARTSPPGLLIPQLLLYRMFITIFDLRVISISKFEVDVHCAETPKFCR